MSQLLLTCQNLSKTYNLKPVFTDINLSVQSGDHIGIIGPNGAGKSTLLKIMAGLEQEDKGLVTRKRGLAMSYCAQSRQYETNDTVMSVVERASSSNSGHSVVFGSLESLLNNAGFADFDATARSLSGGWQKRLALCETLATGAELLIFDEPTNHLDLEGIEWLQGLIQPARITTIVVTHDRYFLEEVCTSIIEINSIFPNGFFKSEGGYGKFMEHKALFVEGQRSQAASSANKLREETAWLRRGAQARSTKQQARIKSALELKDFVESSQERTRRQAVQFSFVSSDRKTKQLIEVTALSKGLGGKQLIQDLSFTLSPGMRLGLAGPNGSGKSTLIKMLMGTLPPDEGTLRRANDLKIIYYDQERQSLGSAASVKRLLAPESDSVVFNGRSLHISSYAKMFGFRFDQLDTALEKLSGGERARLLIARLLLQPADVLILDEPTNDLDIETLEVLEQSLLDFKGAVILVTHDRYLMDRVATGILGLLGDGQCMFFADSSQYAVGEAQARSERLPPSKKSKAQALSSAEKNTETAPKQKIKLSYKDQRDFDSIEKQIQNAEKALAQATALLATPEIADSSTKLTEQCHIVENAQAEVDRLYARWSELEALVNQA
jgi:ATP-binding cassette subfamily F protein uup